MRNSAIACAAARPILKRKNAFLIDLEGQYPSGIAGTTLGHQVERSERLQAVHYRQDADEQKYRFEQRQGDAQRVLQPTRAIDTGGFM